MAIVGVDAVGANLGESFRVCPDDRIGEFWGYPESRAFAELLIDCEEDRRFGRCWSGCCEKYDRTSLSSN